MTKKKLKPRLIEAGPGAGKTHTMVDEIVSAVMNLPPHRFLAAVTYTNAATNTIRERLSAEIQLRPNIFIGTTHSFVNRFVLAPCAELFSLLPDDRIYAPIPVHEKGRGAGIYTKNLINKGIVPYDAMIPKAREILKKSTAIRNRICSRIAYIFVDEFQDADVGMYDIFEHYRKSGSRLSVVGDPEQYVMSFANRGQKVTPFDKIPFFRLKKQAQTESIPENHRSNGELVDFANQFRDDLQQKEIKPHRNERRVLFIPFTEMEQIVNQYRRVSEDIEIEGKQRTRLYISEENATFDSFSDQFRLTPISNLGRKNKTLLGDVLELLSVALDRSQRKICEEYELSRFQLRAVSVKLLKKIQSDRTYGSDRLILFVANEFNHKVSKSRTQLIETSLKLLTAELFTKTTEHKTELYASIRKAKGLQSDAALVVAKRTSELKKWLVTDRNTRIEDKQDKCRLGYVAFTRPREMLCIACLQEIDAELTSVIKQLEIHAVPIDNVSSKL